MTIGAIRLITIFNEQVLALNPALFAQTAAPRVANRLTYLCAAALIVTNGSKTVRLRTSKCFPVCAEKQTQGRL